MFYKLKNLYLFEVFLKNILINICDLKVRIEIKIHSFFVIYF